MDNDLMARRLRPPSEPQRETNYAAGANQAGLFAPPESLEPAWPDADRDGGEAVPDDGEGAEEPAADGHEAILAATQQDMDMTEVPWDFEPAEADASWADSETETWLGVATDAPWSQPQVAPWAETASADAPWAESASADAPWAETASADAPWAETVSAEAPWAESASPDESPSAEAALDEVPWLDAATAEDEAPWDQPADTSPQSDTFAPDRPAWDEPADEPWPQPAFDAREQAAATADPDDAFAPILADVAEPAATLWSESQEAAEWPDMSQAAPAQPIEGTDYDPTAGFRFDADEGDRTTPAAWDALEMVQQPHDTQSGPTPPADLFGVADEPVLEPVSAVDAPAAPTPEAQLSEDSLDQPVAADWAPEAPESTPDSSGANAPAPALVPMVTTVSALPSPTNPGNIVVQIELTFVADVAQRAAADGYTVEVHVPPIEPALDSAPRAGAESEAMAAPPEAAPTETEAAALDFGLPQAAAQAGHSDEGDTSESSPAPSRGDPLSLLPAAAIGRQPRSHEAPALVAAMSIGPAAAPAIKSPGLWFLPKPKAAAGGAVAGAAAEQVAPAPSSPWLTAAMTVGMFALVVVLVLVFLLLTTSILR